MHHTSEGGEEAAHHTSQGGEAPSHPPAAHDSEGAEAAAHSPAHHAGDGGEAAAHPPEPHAGEGAEAAAHHASEGGEAAAHPPAHHASEGAEAAAHPPTLPGDAAEGGAATHEAAGAAGDAGPPPDEDNPWDVAGGQDQLMEPEPEPELSRPSTAQQQMALILPNKDGSYDKDAFRLPPDLDVQLPPESVALAHILSLQSTKRNNVFFISEDTLITSAGNTVVFIRLSDMSQTYLPGLDGGGIGALAVHPSCQMFAVAEKCRFRSPNIYMYQYPSLTLLKVLRSGTEHAYSALAFNDRGDMLASVGGYPDYLLTLWNWDEESIVLRSKAFSQDVYTVRFSPSFDGFLTTSGTGHIRFWKMASTFTGLKLQGLIGKFGNVELSDISTFVELPDGKVLSGTETGEMLMWDGGLIKVVLTRKDGAPCHAGPIDVLIHDRKANIILSAGADGYVRLWDFVKLNEAEADEDAHTLAITPLDEVLVAPGARVKSLLWERRQWLILDEAGALYRVSLPDSGAVSKGCSTARLQEFHSGGIISVMASPKAHLAITAGADGSLRVFDYQQRALRHMVMFGSAITCVCGMPREVDPGLTRVISGHGDGVVRLALRCSDGFKLLSVFKPHRGAVTAIAVSLDGRHLASCGEDNTIFFFALSASAECTPLAYTAVAATATCAVWSPDATRLLVGCKNGKLYDVLAPLDDHENHHSFETSLPSREFAFKLPRPKKAKKEEAAPATGDEKGSGGETDGGGGGAAGAVPPTEGSSGGAEGAGAEAGEGGGSGGDGKDVEAAKEEEEEEYDEDATYEILTVMYPSNALGTETFYVTLAGRGSGQLWSCTFGVQELFPITPIIGTSPTSFLSYTPDGAFMLMGSQDGVVRLAPTGVRACRGGGGGGGEGGGGREGAERGRAGRAGRGLHVAPQCSLTVCVHARPCRSPLACLTGATGRPPCTT